MGQGMLVNFGYGRYGRVTDQYEYGYKQASVYQVRRRAVWLRGWRARCVEIAHGGFGEGSGETCWGWENRSDQPLQRALLLLYILHACWQSRRLLKNSSFRVISPAFAKRTRQ